jgi:diguanylate cyclase (GGDEF)-like protein
MPPFNLLLGTEPAMRLRLQRTLSASGVYGVCVLIQFLGVWMGLTTARTAAEVSVFLLIGQLVFYGLIRSGWSQRVTDSTLTMVQMVFAIFSVGLAYAAYAPVRGAITMIMALVLVFGAFTLPPQRCRQLGWAAVIVLALVMWGSSVRSPLQFEPRIEALHILMVALVLPVIGILAGQLSALRVQQREQNLELRSAMEKLRLLATHDELTGLPNRRKALELLAHEERRAGRQPNPLCIGLIDIDNFKQINDTLGHQAGDDTLRLFAKTLQAAVRPGDVLARWGGEEFILLLPNTALVEAHKVVLRLHGRCADVQSWLNHEELQVSFSAGLSAHAASEPFAVAIGRADAALYSAKQAGRNRVELG